MSKRADQPRVPERPLPRPEGLDAEFYAWCGRGELRFQRCGSCRAWRHLPRILCPSCGSDQWTWEPATGRGVVWSWTTTHQQFEVGMGSRLPYASVVVELEEGLRVVALLADSFAASDLRLDLPVAVEIDVISDEIGLLVCSPHARP